MRTSIDLVEKLAADESKDLSYRTSAALGNSQFGHLLLRLGRTNEAIKYFRRAVELYEMVLVADAGQKQANADLAYAYGGLGNALVQTGNTIEGLPYERKALTAYEQLGSANSSNVLILRDYADTLDRAGETYLLAHTTESAGEAKQLLQESLNIYQAMKSKGALSAVDAGKPDEIAKEIAKCDALLASR
jgi:tetratricopeptide (TPR) repeat protein